MLPQLDLERNGQSLIDTQTSLQKILDGFDDPLEVCSDAPEWDWGFFRQLAYVNHQWRSHVANQPTNLIQPFRYLEAEEIPDVALPDCPIMHCLMQGFSQGSMGFIQMPPIQRAR